MRLALGETAECIFWHFVFETKDLQVYIHEYAAANVLYPTIIWWHIFTSIIH